MTADYNGASGADLSNRRTLCALLTGRAATAPASHDRRALLAVARAHRVDRLAVRAIRERGHDLQDWFSGDGDDLCDERAWAAVEAVRDRELRMVVDALATVAGADAVLIKGAALAHSHYPAPWLRPRLDTDILIAPGSAAPAFAALERLGYRRALTTPGALVLGQASLSRTDDFGVEHALDLHWKIANWQVIAAALSHAEIAARAVPQPALGPHARAAGDADALVLACLHRTAHHRDSSELLWIYDIHLLAARLTPAGWTDVVATAQRAAVKALCARGLALAIEWFDTLVPPEVTQALDTRADAAPEPSAVYLTRGQRLVDGLMSDLHALPARQRLQLLTQHLFPPAAYMRERYQVASPLSMALCYVRRIASGLPKWFSTRSDW